MIKLVAILTYYKIKNVFTVTDLQSSIKTFNTIEPEIKTPHAKNCNKFKIQLH